VKLDWIKIIIAIFAVTVLMAVETDSLRNFVGKHFPFQASLVENITSKSGEEAIFESEPEEEISEEESAPADYEEESEGAEVDLPLIGTSLTSKDSLTEIQNKIDDISEKIDTLKQEVTDLMGKQKIAQEKIKESDNEEEIDEEDLEEPKIEEEEVGQGVGQVICERIIGAQPSKNKVIINEVAWMGGTVSANDEWIELKNISGAPINLIGWQLVDKGKQIKIIFSNGELFSVNGFYLLERSNDESVPNILADLIYTGALSDSDEVLYLFDEACQLEDEAEASPNWPAGDKLEKRSMERKVDLSWQTSLNPGGTPKAENSSGSSVPPVGGGGTPVSEPTVYPKILISEVKIASQDNEKNEFVELYNPQEVDANLTNWYLQRKTKGTTDFSTFASKTLFLSKKIKAKDYFLIARQDSTFSNLADVITTYPLTENNTLVLKNPNREIVDMIGWGEVKDFEKAPTQNPQPGESIGRKWIEENYQDTDDNSNDFEIQKPTPKTKNETETPQPPEQPQDTTPPQVGFASISSLQTNLSFTVSWLGEDPLDTATPSGIDGFLLRYSQNKEDWNYFPSESEYTQETQYIFTGENNQTYYFQIKAKDKAGNESEWIEILTEINTLPIVINEIAWMGTETAYQDEWIELYNNTNLSLSLDGWLFKAADGAPEINLTGTIAPRSFYLLERTDDETVPDIPADQIYTGSLGNEGEDLAIYDKSVNLIDQVDCSAGWFGGDNSTKQTMERKNPSLPGNNLENWATSNSPGGTPKSQNSQFTP